MPTLLPTQQILLVESDATQAEAIADILKSEGLSVCTILSGDEATNALRQKKPPFAIVITNLVLPNKDGLAVVRAAIKYNPDCSVMAIGTFSTGNEASEAIDLGAYVAVTKPFHPNHFKNALKRLVERAAMLSECKRYRGVVAELESRVESLEAANGRMEMLAKQISPASAEQRELSLEELEQLAGLRAKGVLTEEQFQSARQLFLSRWMS